MPNLKKINALTNIVKPSPAPDGITSKRSITSNNLYLASAASTGPYDPYENLDNSAVNIGGVQQPPRGVSQNAGAAHCRSRIFLSQIHMCNKNNDSTSPST